MFLWGGREIHWSKWHCLKYSPRGLWSHQRAGFLSHQAECALWGAQSGALWQAQQNLWSHLVEYDTHTISKHISVHIKNGCPPPHLTPPDPTPPHAEELLSKSPWGWLCRTRAWLVLGELWKRLLKVGK